MKDARLGWKKDHFDPRAVYYSSLPKVKKLVTLPAKVSLERYLPPDVPWNQGDLGSCVGHGIGMNITMRAIEQKVYSKLNQRFSPGWIYDGARELEGNSREDLGAYPTDGWLWLMQYGCLPEEFYPYRDVLRTKRPSTLGLEAHSKDWPFGSNFIRADNGVEGLQASLAVGNMISIGTPWPNAWIDEVKKDGILKTISAATSMAGGHETCLVGYQTIKNRLYFRGVNSWGSEWGDGGLYWMPATAFNVFKRSFDGYDAQFPLLNWRP